MSIAKPLHRQRSSRLRRDHDYRDRDFRDERTIVTLLFAFHTFGATLRCMSPVQVSSRLYSSIAAGCIPVVVSDSLVGAFASYIDYDSIWLKVMWAHGISLRRS